MALSGFTAALYSYRQTKAAFFFFFLKGSTASGKAVLGLLKGVPGERRGRLSARGVCGRKSCARAERKPPADLGAPSPSERSAGGVQPLGRTPGGGVAHQIPHGGEPCRGCPAHRRAWEAAGGGHSGPSEVTLPSKTISSNEKENTALKIRTRVLGVVQKGRKPSPVPSTVHTLRHHYHIQKLC